MTSSGITSRLLLVPACVLFAVIAAIPLTLIPCNAQSPTPAAAPAGTGHLAFSVVIIDNLTPKPVPLTDFTITDSSSKQPPQTIRSDAQGEIALDLMPGSYTIASVKPVEFNNHSYSWSKSFTIQVGQQTKLDLTDADATATEAAPTRQISPAAQIYNQLQSGIVTVEGDRGQGTGFVVDKSGLILTNEHVIEGGRWAAIRFKQGTRLPAVIVDRDPAADVAVLAFNPEVYKDFQIIPLADPAQGPLVLEGENVLTIGSPMGQEKVLTTGIVSKIDPNYILSDININHGNSGGPLLNYAGQAVGLTTFGDNNEPNGPGISGIVPITKALPVLARARKEWASMTFADSEILPDVSPVPIPDDALAAAKTKDTKPDTIEGPKDFRTVIVTPFYNAAQLNELGAALSESERKRVEKRGQNSVQDELNSPPRHDWETYGIEKNDAVVEIAVIPELKEKSSSLWLRVLITGPKGQKKLEFRDDFWDMALYRGGTLVYPVIRARTSVQALYADDNIEVNDSAIAGDYFYDPSVFQPGADLTLYVRRESDLNRWDVVHIDEKTQNRIWNLFAPYRIALGDAKSEIVVGLSTTVHTPPQAGAETDNSELMAQYVGQAVTPTMQAASTTAASPAGATLASQPTIAATSPPAALAQSTPTLPISPVAQPSPTSAAHAAPAPAAQAAPPPPSQQPDQTSPPPPAAPTPTARTASQSTAPAPPPPTIDPSVVGGGQHVIVTMNNGNSYYGTVTKLDGSVYTLATSSGTMQIQSTDIKSVQYPDKQ